jgi:hypothetical protein
MRLDIAMLFAPTTLMLAALCVCNGPAFAQRSSSAPSPIGMTSPLGVGSASPVRPVGIPLGATAIGSPGISPLTSGASPMVPTTVTSAGCRGIGGSIPESSFGLGGSGPGMSSGMGSSMGSSMTGSSFGTGISTAGTSTSTTAFDGGGMAGSASGGCPQTGGSSLAGPAGSASSPTGMGSASTIGRIGIPMGSTELGAGGLSPVTSVPSALGSTLSTTPCLGLSPTTGMSSTTGTPTGMPTFSSSC